MIPATIRFSAKLEKSVLTLPKAASRKLGSKGATTIEATINGFPFRAPLEPDGKGSHQLKVSPILLDAAGAEPGDTATVEIIRVGDEPAARLPADLRAAIAARRGRRRHGTRSHRTRARIGSSG